jgi:hypothetical protein
MHLPTESNYFVAPLPLQSTHDQLDTKTPIAPIYQDHERSSQPPLPDAISDLPCGTQILSETLNV